MIDLQDISKSYGDVRAVEEVSFSVEKGELFGLIGPDGAGKTTIIRMVASLLLPDSGSLSFDGRDIVKDYAYVRRHTGYMPGTFSLYQDLSVQENLRFFATVFQTTVEENYDLIRDIYVQLEPFRKRRAGALSGGMKQKLALCCALVHRPLVLLLDEPTTGVDAVSRKEFWDMLSRLRQEGISILVSTPYMDEAARCDRIGLIQEGRLLDVGKPGEITEKFAHHLWAVRSDNIYKLLSDLRAHPDLLEVFPFGRYLHASTDKDNLDPSALAQYLRELGHSGIEVKAEKPDIEDYFMSLMTRQRAGSELNGGGALHAE